MEREGIWAEAEAGEEPLKGEAVSSLLCDQASHRWQGQDGICW